MASSAPAEVPSVDHAGPRISVVATILDGDPDVAPLLQSLDALTSGPGGAAIDLVMVMAGDDPSTRTRIGQWAAGRARVDVIPTLADRSRGAARNVGLAASTGDWATFADPRRPLIAADVRRLRDGMRRHPDAAVVSAPEVEAGEPDPVGPGRRQRRIDLDRRADGFPRRLGAAAYRLGLVRTGGLRCDPRLAVGPDATQLADTVFAAECLLAAPRPILALVRPGRGPESRPAGGGPWRAREDGTDGHVTDDVRFGMLGLLERSRTRGPGGRPVPWVQHLVIDRVVDLLAADDTITTAIHLPAAERPEFVRLLTRVLAALDPDVVVAHRSRPMIAAWMDLLAHAGRAGDWHSPVVVRTKVDREAGLQRVVYRFVGRRPDESFIVDGSATTPHAAKTMAHTYFGHAWLWERISWVAAGALEVHLDGALVPVVDRWPVPGTTTGRTHAAPRLRAMRAMPPRRLLRTAIRWSERRGYRLVTTPVRLLAKLPPYRGRYHDAWVLMDRVFNADDNGERLFEFLRTERRDLNAWFVIEPGTADWARLRERWGDRVVAYRSFSWVMLMLSCAWVLSSHGSRAVATPPRVIHLTGRPTWRYAFLQHGVMKDDLSKWLNRRDIDLFVVSTEAERASVITDGTGYRYTTREVVDAGLPRFDRLLAKGRSTAPDARDLILVAPTWRMWLTAPPDARMDRPVIDTVFFESAYLRAWLALLGDPVVAAAAARCGRRIAFMPHPNMQSMLARIQLPDGVEPLSFAGNDVQGLYARCALLVTDYSSVAFNAAVLDRPVVYYQFDRDVVMAGAHLGRQGYFDYARDGFGPVATDHEAAVAAIVAAIEHGPESSEPYRSRIEATFPQRDGRACARVVAAAEALRRPVTASKRAAGTTPVAGPPITMGHP